LNFQGDFKFFIPAALIKQGKSTAKQVLKALRTSVPQLMDAKLHVISDPKLQEELAYLEELKKKQAKFFKIGVLYGKAGQTTEEEIFGNEHGSEAFEEFLKLLGERIELQGWKGFRGDLDVQGKSGEYSVYTKLREYEIMFHVSTYLPYNAQDPQQIMRKKYIGNDLSTIVFMDGEHSSFTPPTVSGDFLRKLTRVTHPFGTCLTRDIRYICSRQSHRDGLQARGGQQGRCTRIRSPAPEAPRVPEEHLLPRLFVDQNPQR
jgi:hypothetical protein